MKVERCLLAHIENLSPTGFEVLCLEILNLQHRSSTVIKFII